MTLRRGEVVLIRMQFHQVSSSKVRPALVLLDTGDDDSLLRPITSQTRLSDYDLQLEERRAAGLNVSSSVRIHKLAVLPKSELLRSIGSLSDRDHESLDLVLCRSFCLRAPE